MVHCYTARQVLTNNSVNFLLYCAMSSQFRASLQSVLWCGDRAGGQGPCTPAGSRAFNISKEEVLG